MPHPMTICIREQLAAAADPLEAPAMQAYMKTEQPYYGVKATPRKQLFKEARQAFPGISFDEYRQIVTELWEGTHREEMYQALEACTGYRKYYNIDSWELYDWLVHRSTWWDTLDWIAGKIVSKLVLKHRKLEADLVRWRSHGSLWVRRASILAHLKHKEQTNVKLMSETMLLLAGEKEFFIRKAIGWQLREYSKSNPDWVVQFVREHDAALSNLTKREALKRIR